MADITFQKIRTVGVLSSTEKSSFELNYGSWREGAEPKYDLRKWGNNGTKAYKGITITRDELEQMYEILDDNLHKERSITRQHKYEKGKAKATIYEVLGQYSSSPKMNGQITYLSWNEKAPKYDIRPWNEDYSVCGRGVTLDEDEIEKLLNILKFELNLDAEEEIEDDASDLDDLIFNS